MKSKTPANPERLLPPHAPGMRIGLFGGTFDPPHLAHLGAALLALKRLKLDRVWWLVTPGNPLASLLLLMPLAPEVGGLADTHQGGRQFTSQDDPDWKILAAWVNGQTL